MISPRLVLHIGTEKTGTSSIQSFAHLNRQQLQDKNSILYPDDLGNEFGHTKIALLAYHDSQYDDLTIANCGADDRSQLIASWRQKLVSIVNNTECHSLFISSEFFQSRLRAPEHLARLRTIIQPLFSDIEIVMYARNPLDCGISLMSEAIKNGSTKLELPDPKSAYINHICNHQLSVEMWQRAFPEAKIVVKPFARDSFFEECIIKDIFDYIGVTDFVDFNFPKRQNESLCLPGMYVLSRLNQRIPKIVSGRINPVRGDLANHIVQFFHVKSKYFPSKKEVQAYEGEFYDSQRWIAEKFWNGNFELWGSPRKGISRKHQESVDCISRLSTDIYMSEMIECFASAWQKIS